MAMTKKEKEILEQALTAAALRTTCDIEPDVIPTDKEVSSGWLPIGSESDFPRIVQACSSGISHTIGQPGSGSSRGALSLYSTRLLALKALRRMVEIHAAKRLRAIDRQIEQELNNVDTLSHGVSQ